MLRFFFFYAIIAISSEERAIKMYPLDFEEFCWAFGEEMLVTYIKECFEKLKPLEDDFHHKVMLLFKQYMLIGGMPKSVFAYLENNRSFVAADTKKRDILTLNRKDIGKANVKYRSRISSIFEQIPAFRSLHEKCVRLSNIESNANGYKLFFYTHYSEEKHRNDIEIDFLISNGSITKPKIYPLEVKSGKRYKTESLEKFVFLYRRRIGKTYIIHPKNLSIKGDIICIPSYMAFCL